MWLKARTKIINGSVVPCRVVNYEGEAFLYLIASKIYWWQLTFNQVLICMRQSRINKLNIHSQARAVWIYPKILLHHRKNCWSLIISHFPINKTRLGLFFPERLPMLSSITFAPESPPKAYRGITAMMP